MRILRSHFTTALIILSIVLIPYLFVFYKFQYLDEEQVHHEEESSQLFHDHHSYSMLHDSRHHKKETILSKSVDTSKYTSSVSIIVPLFSKNHFSLHHGKPFIQEQFLSYVQSLAQTLPNFFFSITLVYDEAYLIQHESNILGSNTLWSQESSRRKYWEEFEEYCILHSIDYKNLRFRLKSISVPTQEKAEPKKKKPKFSWYASYSRQEKKKDATPNLFLLDIFQVYSEILVNEPHKTSFVWILPIHWIKISHESPLFIRDWIANMDTKVGIISPLITKKDGSYPVIYSAGMQIGLGKHNTPVFAHRLSGFYIQDQRVNSIVDCALYGIFLSLKTLQHYLNEFKQYQYTSYGIKHMCLDLFHNQRKDTIVFPHVQIEVEKSFAPQQLKISKQKREVFLQVWQPKIVERLQRSYELQPSTTVAWEFGAGGCAGWALEAISYTTELEYKMPIRIITGKNDFCKGLPHSTVKSLYRLLSHNYQQTSIWISHKPLPNYPKFPYRGARTVKKRPSYLVMRSMYESKTIPSIWPSIANYSFIDEIWVPSLFLVDAFKQVGMPANKIFHIPEPVDTYFYDPAVVTEYPLKNKKKFNFLTIGKWEPRKGFELLFEAYFKEFSSMEDVNLYIVTYLYMSNTPRDVNAIREEILAVADNLGLDRDSLPNFEIISEEVKTTDMPRIYKAADAFVLATKGDGWCLPAAEAAAMALPTIVTRYSGPLDFLKDDHSYLIDIEPEPTEEEIAAEKKKKEEEEKKKEEEEKRKKEEEKKKKAAAKLKNNGTASVEEEEEEEDTMQNWWKNWSYNTNSFKEEEKEHFATPKVSHLRQLMRHVFENTAEAKLKGQKARQYMIDNYSPRVISNIVASHLRRIEFKLIKRNKK